MALVVFLFVLGSGWGREPTLSEKAYQKILNAQFIQDVVYADIRGLGKKDALVIYSKPSTTINTTIVGGVAVFDHDKGLLWQEECSCYGISADLICFDKDNPKLPFIQVTPCSNASIGCGMGLFRWMGTTFQRIYTDGSGNERILMTMPDGNPVMQTAWRGGVFRIYCGTKRAKWWIVPAPIQLFIKRISKKLMKHWQLKSGLICNRCWFSKTFYRLLSMRGDIKKVWISAKS